MKKVKVAAAMILATAVGVATLTACSEGSLDASKFKIANYAHSLDSTFAKVKRVDYSETNNVNNAVKTFTKLNSFDSISDYYGKHLIVKTGEKYALYDAEENRIIHNEYYSISGTRASYVNIFIMRKTSGGKYQFAGPDGALLTSKSFDSNYVDVSLMGQAQAVTGTEKRINYYKITLGNEGQTVLYFSMTSYYDREDKWESVTEAQAKEAIGNKYAVGTQLGLVTEKIDVNNNLYPVNNYEGIEYSTEGSELKTTYTYYRNGEKLSSVTVTMGEIVGYVGDYVYYYEMEPVKADATKGYNFEMTAVATVKANISLYRYNIIKGGGKMAVDMGGYVISPDVFSMSLYNYSTDKVDALVVPAIKKVGGVAVASGAISSSDLTILNSSMIVLNSSGKAIADLSGTNLTSLNVYTLEEGKYLAGNYIIDEKLNTVAELPGNPCIWAEKQLIATNVSGYGDMLVNYGGKVVLEPKTSLTFYGDTALGYDGKVYSLAGTEAKEIEDIVTCADGETLTANSDGFLVKSSYNSSNSSYTLTLYTLTGSRIATIQGCTSRNIYIDNCGKAKITGITVRDGSDTKIVYYKLG